MGRLLVGYDGSPAARRALDHAKELAQKGGHEIVLLTVVPPQVKASTLGKMMPAGLELPPELDRTFEQNARLRLEELAAELAQVGVKARAEVRAGDTPEQFVKAASELGASEIVIGAAAYRTDRERGPNAVAIAERATVRVTVVP